MFSKHTAFTTSIVRVDQRIVVSGTALPGYFQQYHATQLQEDFSQERHMRVEYLRPRRTCRFNNDQDYADVRSRLPVLGSHIPVSQMNYCAAGSTPLKDA